MSPDLIIDPDTLTCETCKILFEEVKQQMELRDLAREASVEIARIALDDEEKLRDEIAGLKHKLELAKEALIQVGALPIVIKSIFGEEDEV